MENSRCELCRPLVTGLDDSIGINDNHTIKAYANASIMAETAKKYILHDGNRGEASGIVTR